MLKKKYLIPYFRLIMLRPHSLLAASFVEGGSTDGQGQGQFDANAKSSSFLDTGWNNEETWVKED